MKEFLLQLFTWWNGQTMGTRFHTWRHGEKVGTDAFGNTYYRTRGGAIDPVLGFERRWVIYNGEAEASKIPPGWYGWMHHKLDVVPDDENFVARPWMKPHRPNQTGTAGAYRPKGSILSTGERPHATGDYRAWQPD
ncbi:NADH:ubiquinone oxidoreductase subunit NDUFA12 [Methyloraptor flagellatus]|jgi:NADH:ubiquinone oxidoreductase subunit|uniref:NADH:ubiquinone oxidoreductase subunit NDUFA12 n=1 Tax=Methyloraptor flagellatus TaxID=3162530 RepID=A0AAU7XEH5_9HYPH